MKSVQPSSQKTEAILRYVDDEQIAVVAWIRRHYFAASNGLSHSNIARANSEDRENRIIMHVPTSGVFRYWLDENTYLVLLRKENGLSLQYRSNAASCRIMFPTSMPLSSQHSRLTITPNVKSGLWVWNIIEIDFCAHHPKWLLRWFCSTEERRSQPNIKQRGQIKVIRIRNLMER